MIGRKIYFFRNKNNLTQEKLCEGICSTSYLSKIENEKTIPSDEVIELLCQRMGVHRKDIDGEDEKEFEAGLNDWFYALIKKQINQANNQYNKLKKMYDQIENPLLTLKYDIIRGFHYMQVKEDIDIFSFFVTNITKPKNIFNNELKLLYYYVNGIYLSRINKQKEASLSFEQSFNHLAALEDKEYILADIYYRLALVYSKMHNAFLAYDNAIKGLEIVNKNYDFDMSLRLLTLIGINKARVSQYKESIHTFNRALALAEKLNDKSSISNIYYNLGQIKMELNETSQAIQFFKQSLNYISEDDYFKLVKTYFGLAKVCSQAGLNDDVEMYISKGIELSQSKNIKDYLLHFKVLKIQRENTLNKNLNFLKNEVISYFTNTESWNYVAEYSELMAEGLCQHLKYKDGVKFLYIANEARKKCIKPEV